MTTNPYEPPVSDPAGTAGPPPPEKSFARRTSFVLAAVGFVVFWGAVMFAASKAAADEPAEGVQIAAGFAVLLAMVTHLVGVGIVFAAPRGRRLLPGLLNGVSFAIMVAIVAYGLSKG